MVRRVRGPDASTRQRRLCQGRDAVHGRDLRRVGSLSIQFRAADAGGKRAHDAHDLRAYGEAAKATARCLARDAACRHRASQSAPGAAARALPRFPQPRRPALVFRAPGAELHHRRARRRAAHRFRHLSGRKRRRPPRSARGGIALIQGTDRVRSRASLVLGLLLVAYIFNYLDRQILGILAGPIIRELHLTDKQFGALSGPPFAILYSVLGIPFAYLADRTSRSRVIAAAVAIWSALTGLCGTAVSFWQFFFFRMAGGVAPSYALIADYFEPRRRARALAIFSLGVPIGLALGTLVGAYIAQAVSWRAAFFTMGVAGVVLAPIMLIFVRDVPRRHTAS